MKDKLIVIRNIKFFGFNYERVNDVIILLIFGRILFQRVGTLYAFFNKVGFNTQSKRFKVYVRKDKKRTIEYTCNSCKKGYNGTKGKGYQPCGCNISKDRQVKTPPKSE